MLGGGVGTHTCRERGSEGAGPSAGLREGGSDAQTRGSRGPLQHLSQASRPPRPEVGRERREGKGGGLLVLVASLAGLRAPLWERMVLLGGFR